MVVGKQGIAILDIQISLSKDGKKKNILRSFSAVIHAGSKRPSIELASRRRYLKHATGREGLSKRMNVKHGKQRRVGLEV